MNMMEHLVVRSLCEGAIVSEESDHVWQKVDKDEGRVSWVMSVSVAPYNPNLHTPWFIDEDEDEDEIAEGRERLQGMIDEEGTPTHMARIVIRSSYDGVGDEPLILVDGWELYLRVAGDRVHSIWEEIWNGNQPDYYGGPIDEAIEWVSELPGTTGECYSQLYSPFK